MDQTSVMKGLRARLLDLKHYKDTITKDEDLEKRDIARMEDEMHTLETMIEKKVREIKDDEDRLKHYDDLLRQSQEALGKLTDNTKKLEDVIASELDSLKK